ncbi:hypothetical protein [Magnetospirillum sp. ME-1]|uniref:hypothetical protein n=1 Tax=Magnetospirillum sp. ME-1 TaxID=1639348 RepID=UPI001F2979B9|nr:hypothetical protein [Magnetospirillum sp. ME-1]
MTFPPPFDDDKIAEIRHRLAALDAERAALEIRLADLLTLQAEHPIPATPFSSARGIVTVTASPAGQDRSVPFAVPGARGCLSEALEQSQEWQIGLFTGLPPTNGYRACAASPRSNAVIAQTGTSCP